MILPGHDNEAIKATIDMGGLSRLPDNVQNLRIEKKAVCFPDNLSFNLIRMNFKFKNGLMLVKG
jgi:hypothetical protein